MKKSFSTFKNNIQVIAASVVIVAGLTFASIGLLSEPVGDIPPQTNLLIGELLTFSGSLLGIDYSYKWKVFKHTSDLQEEDK